MKGLDRMAWVLLQSGIPAREVADQLQVPLARVLAAGAEGDRVERLRRHLELELPQLRPRRGNGCRP